MTFATLSRGRRQPAEHYFFVLTEFQTMWQAPTAQTTSAFPLAPIITSANNKTLAIACAALSSGMPSLAACFAGAATLLDTTSPSEPRRLKAELSLLSPVLSCGLLASETAISIRVVVLETSRCHPCHGCFD